MNASTNVTRGLGLLSLLSLFLHADIAQAQWISTLSQDARDSILWSADHEDATLHQWQEPGVATENLSGGILNTGDDVSAKASTKLAHSGKYSVATTINNAFRAKNGNRAVRLMRWADKPWKDNGRDFPKSAYYSTWMLIPQSYNTNKYQPWDPGDGGWWIVFEFKAHDDQNVSQTAWTLNAYHDDETGKLEFGLNFQLDGFKGYAQKKPLAVPIGEWFHVEAQYVVSSSEEGEIRVWQNGTKIFDIHDVKTAASKDREFAVWGLTNYTDHIVGGDKPGSATIYFDDAIVSTKRVSKELTGNRLQSRHPSGQAVVGGVN